MSPRLLSIFFWWSFVSQLVSDLSASLSLFCLPLLSCVPHLSPNLFPSSLLAMVVPRVTPTVFFCRLLVFSLLLLLSPTEDFALVFRQSPLPSLIPTCRRTSCPFGTEDFGPFSALVHMSPTSSRVVFVSHFFLVLPYCMFPAFLTLVSEGAVDRKGKAV